MKLSEFNVPGSVLLMLALAVPGFGQTFKVESVANPSTQGSLQANWSVTQDGSPLLTWVETSKDGSYNLLCHSPRVSMVREAHGC